MLDAASYAVKLPMLASHNIPEMGNQENGVSYPRTLRFVTRVSQEDWKEIFYP
jgi:hypothetical protein